MMTNSRETTIRDMKNWKNHYLKRIKLEINGNFKPTYKYSEENLGSPSYCLGNLCLRQN